MAGCILQDESFSGQVLFSICNKVGHNDAWCFLNKKTRKDTITDDEQPNDNTMNEATKETTGNSAPSE